MRVVFVEKSNGPERLVCDAEVVFEAEAGPLAGMKLVSFAVWRSVEGEIFVSLPARPYEAGGERRFYDLLRSVHGDAADGKRVRDWIKEQYAAQHASAA
jgi:hypothetical protein